jgi:GntR family transcriptional regulator
MESGSNLQGEAVPAVGSRKPLSPFHAIDKTSIVGLAEQIQAQILGLIHSGRLAVGDLLPGEQELGQIFGVNRTVGRKALVQIEGIGYAVRQKGRGTFVTFPKVIKEISGVSGFSAEMRALGMQPGARVLAAERREASTEVAARLAIFRGTPVFHLQRLRLADQRPVAIEESYLELARFPGILKIDFNNASLYDVLSDDYGVQLTRADDVVEAEGAGRREARLLDISPRTSLLVVTRTVWAADGRPVEMARSHYRGDRFRAVLGPLPPATLPPPTVDEGSSGDDD